MPRQRLLKVPMVPRLIKNAEALAQPALLNCRHLFRALVSVLLSCSAAVIKLIKNNLREEEFIWFTASSASSEKPRQELKAIT